MRYLRQSDGKGEYDNEAFRSILTEFGIAFEPSPPYTQHKNGVSERMIQTHNAEAREMLLDCSLPPSMWVEAVSTANYLLCSKPELIKQCTTIWHFWDPRRRLVIQSSNVTFSESDVSGGLGLDTSAVGLGLGASSGSLGNLERNTGRYDLRKRSRAVAHRIRVEEEPMDSADPVSYREAVAHPRFGQKWSDAVDEELRSFAENSTWDCVGLEDVPAGVTPISSKWVFKTKELPGGGIRYEARLVIRGFEQQAGVDFNETFAPVAKLQSLRIMLALAVVHDWEFKQIDMVTAFLNPKVDCDVYMALSQGIEADKPQVCKLRKSLCGLKQAPRLWYEHIDHFLRSLGLQRCEYGPIVYLWAGTTLTN